MPDAPDELMPKSEQTTEIEEALGTTVSNTEDEWDIWTRNIQAQVDKLIDGKRMDRYAILAIGGIGLLACGAVAMLGRAVQGIAAGMAQLGENQAYIGHVLGLDKQPEPTLRDKLIEQTEPGKQYEVKENGAVEEIKVQDAKTFDLPIDAEVGKPFEGPATEASEAAKKQLAEDKAAGIIDEFKGAEPDAL